MHVAKIQAISCHRLARIFGALALIIAMLGCGSPAGTAGSESRKTVSGTVKAPLFSLVDLNGKKLSLTDLKGQVVFLEFWATWCPPCVVSIPEVGKLVDEYKGKRVTVVSLSVDDNERKVRAFVNDHGMTNRVAMVGGSQVDVRYGVRGIPAFFVIDQKGQVANLWEGYHPSMPRDWRKELDRLLKV